ncbi:MAG: L,D-transpeptidase [Roseiflexaceae bacterium]|nr:L,D-transpeptidase [Roseiflexaceae bacterium]
MRACRIVLVACLTAMLGSLWMPAAAVAQASALYFPASGHFLDDTYGFLSFWQAHEGERLLGFPINEAQLVDGLAQQYFERGRLEQAIDPANNLISVRPGRVGAEYVEAMWKTFPAAPKRRGDELRFESTGHTLRGPFLDFWQAHGGEAIFGEPLSEALWEVTERGRRMVQYFERAQLERDAAQAGTDQEMSVGELGRALATLKNIDTARVSNWGVQEYGPAAPQAANVISLDATPTPLPQPTAPPQLRPAAKPKPAAPAPARSIGPTKGKLIMVNLSDQWLYAYEDGSQVFSAPITTGRKGMETPTGTFAIYSKLKLQTMDGVDNGVPWEVPNVPNVMYIHGGVALHGTYWHNKFGSGALLSHGCVNLPLKSAAWLYGWAPVGTTVKVTY